MKNREIKHTIISQIFGTPIWTEDHDGEFRKRRAIELVDGRVLFKGISGRLSGNADGTVNSKAHSYIVRWHPRYTLFG